MRLEWLLFHYVPAGMAGHTGAAELAWLLSICMDGGARTGPKYELWAAWGCNRKFYMSNVCNFVLHVEAYTIIRAKE